MLEGRMVIPCTIYKQLQDEYGDIRAVNPVSSTCWFRQIDILSPTPNREADTSSAMAWFRPAEDVAEGYLVTIDGSTYRITQVISARRLGEVSIQFKKCILQRHEAFVS